MRPTRRCRRVYSGRSLSIPEPRAVGRSVRGIEKNNPRPTQITQVVISITSALRKAGHAPQYQKIGPLKRASLNIKSFPQPKEAPMLSLLAFVVVAVALATPFVVPLMWGQLENPGSAS